jgi:hypothetical protein
VSESDGTFRFVGVMAGRYRLAGGGERGLSHETLNVEISDQESVRKVRLALRAQPEVELQFMNWQGAPVSNALIFEVSGNEILSMREAPKNEGRIPHPPSFLLAESPGGYAPIAAPHGREMRSSGTPSVSASVRDVISGVSDASRPAGSGEA